MEPQRFPLQRLPRDAILNVIKTMNMMDIMTFSLSTKATKALVVALKMKAPRISLSIMTNQLLELEFDNGSLLSIEFHEHEGNRWIEGEPLLKISKPTYVSASLTTFIAEYFRNEEERPLTPWKKLLFEFQDWIQHFLDLFVGGQINQVNFFPESQRYDIQSVTTAIEKQIDNRNSFTYIENCPDEYHDQIHQTFQSIGSLVITRRTPFFQKLILPNYHKLSFATFSDVTLDELLRLNPVVLYLDNPGKIFAKEINRFIKCWVKGTHRRLRYARFEQRFANVPDEEDLIKGTRYRRAPEDRVLSVPFSRSNFIRGGWDIRGKNGRQATVALEKEDAFWDIEIKSVSRTLTHYQYIDWPEGGTPKHDHQVMYKLLQVLNESKTPVIVHSMLGLDRAMAFVGIQLGAQFIEDQLSTRSTINAVHFLRQHRPYCIP